jgi:hypothetical protein
MRFGCPPNHRARYRRKTMDLGTYKEFKFNGIHYRVWNNGDIERYDGGSIGYTKTHSLAVRAEARRLGLVS